MPTRVVYVVYVERFGGVLKRCDDVMIVCMTVYMCYGNSATNRFRGVRRSERICWRGLPRLITRTRTISYLMEHHQDIERRLRLSLAMHLLAASLSYVTSSVSRRATEDIPIRVYIYIYICIQNPEHPRRTRYGCMRYLSAYPPFRRRRNYGLNQLSRQVYLMSYSYVVAQVMS